MSAIAAGSPYQFNRFVVFGDSLSDTGNLYRYSAHVIPKTPPYYQGHFSNGEIWIEQLAKAYFPNDTKSHIHNYAFGGAGAVISKKENLPYTLWHEVNDYLYFHHDTQKNTTLYFVWMGANNYLNGPTDVEEITTKVVRAISKEVEKLIQHGAVMMAIANLPDMSVVPEAHQEGTTALLSALTERHNHKLQTRVNELRHLYPNVRFVYVDTERLFKKVEDNPLAYGITNQTTPCYDGGYFLKGEASIDDNVLRDYLINESKKTNTTLNNQQVESLISNKMLRVAVKNAYLTSLLGEPSVDTSCQGDMFWDTVHPTTHVHGYMADYIKAAIQDSGLEVK
jgi:phospholipase/lecithinase/hemolysin